MGFFVPDDEDAVAVDEAHGLALQRRLATPSEHEETYLRVAVQHCRVEFRERPRHGEVSVFGVDDDSKVAATRIARIEGDDEVAD